MQWLKKHLTTLLLVIVLGVTIALIARSETFEEFKRWVLQKRIDKRTEEIQVVDERQAQRQEAVKANNEIIKHIDDTKQVTETKRKATVKRIEEDMTNAEVAEHLRRLGL